MTITFFFNFLNHHQVLVADEMYRLLGEDFHFLGTYKRDPSELKGGVDYSDRLYCILAAESAEAKKKAHELIQSSDVCVFGAGNLDYVSERANTGKLSFEVGERWLKQGLLNVLSPRLLKWWWLYQIKLRNKPFYKLCCSAFAAQDDEKMFVYKGRHFKWGYFTEVKELRDESLKLRAPETIEIQLKLETSSSPTNLMWCARFLKLKHPELPVKMAAKLKANGYNFVLDFYGSGDEEEPTKQLAYELGVEDVVKFHGAKPNAEILQAMREHDVFLFTSNRLEGWGAVVNESMGNGCVVVASDCIGSTPYLVEDGVTGFCFKSADVDSLTEKVQWLLDHPKEMHEMQHNAYQQMLDIWSPKHAAESLLTLINDIQNNKDCSITEGPCSKA